MNRCVNGHDLDQVGVYRYWNKRRGRWCQQCLQCKRDNDQRRRRQEVSRQEQRISQEVGRTERILSLRVKLETAMPWERAEIEHEIAQTDR